MRDAVPQAEVCVRVCVCVCLHARVCVCARARRAPKYTSKVGYTLSFGRVQTIKYTQSM